MSVYVDQEENSFGRMTMCHMLADSLEELHAFADQLGLRRSWFQPQSTPHYDLSKTKRVLALQLGAIEIDRCRTVEITKEWRREILGIYPPPDPCCEECREPVAYITDTGKRLCKMHGRRMIEYFGTDSVIRV